MFLALSGVVLASKRIETQLFEFREGVQLGENGVVVTGVETNAAVASTNQSEVYNAPAVEQAILLRRNDSYQDPYSLTSAATVTVSRVTGYTEYSLYLTNNVMLAVNLTDYPTNSVGMFAVAVIPNGYVMSVDTNSISATAWAEVTFSTNAVVNDLVLRKPYNSIKFTISNEVFE